MTGHASYTTRQAAYDLRKLRGKDLIAKPAGTRRYNVRSTPPALSQPCSHSVTRSSHRSSPASAAPAKDASPRTGLASTATMISLRIGMQNLFHDLGITVNAAAAA